MSTYKDPLELLTQDPVEFSLVSMKSKMMLIVAQLIKEQNWTQAQAAKEIGVSQPRISNLMKGQISKFSIDMLMEMLGRLGYLSHITFNPADKDKPIAMEIKRTAL